MDDFEHGDGESRRCKILLSHRTFKFVENFKQMHEQVQRKNALTRYWLYAAV